MNSSAEEFILKEKTVLQIVDKSAKLNKRLNEIENLMESGQTIFICIGYPGSGKSSFGKSLKKKFEGKLDICCRDEIGTTEKCLKVAKSQLNDGKHVYVDSTNPGKLFSLEIENKNGKIEFFVNFFEVVIK